MIGGIGVGVPTESKVRKRAGGLTEWVWRKVRLMDYIVIVADSCKSLGIPLSPPHT